MDNKYILVEKKDGIATITLNRPERLNALIPPMRVEMRLALEDAGDDASIRVVIITGAGRGFCAGAEVVTIYQESEMADDEPLRAKLLLPVQTPRIDAIIRSLKKPIIAALNGVVVGAGIGLALSCDVIIASDQARFRMGFGRMGVPLADATSYLLPRRIGAHRTLELAFTNDMIDAREMERIGLVNKIVPHEQLLPAAREMAKKMFQIPPLTLALIRKVVYDGLSATSIESQMILERFAEKTLLTTEDTKEAQKSFIEKREPVYKGK